MRDPRLLACNGRVAALDLKGKVQAERFVEGWPQQVAGGLGNLFSAPAGALQRQLYPGEQVTVYDEHAGWSFVKARAHGYVGYIQSQQLRPPNQAPSTHYISVPISHSYGQCDMKSGITALLVMGSQLQNLQEETGFIKTQFGWVPKQHVQALSDPLHYALNGTLSAVVTAILHDKTINSNSLGPFFDNDISQEILAG